MSRRRRLRSGRLRSTVTNWRRSGTRLSFKTIESVSDFHRVMPALAELHRAVGAPRSPAAHPQWVRAWWETRPRARRIVCFLGLLDGDLRVFIPLEFGTRRFSGLPVPKAETTKTWHGAGHRL